MTLAECFEDGTLNTVVPQSALYAAVDANSGGLGALTSCIRHTHTLTCLGPTSGVTGSRAQALPVGWLPFARYTAPFDDSAAARSSGLAVMRVGVEGVREVANLGG